MRKKHTSKINDTEYLLQNPANAAHLVKSIAELKAGKTTTVINSHMKRTQTR